jgi:hypothetical protein
MGFTMLFADQKSRTNSAKPDIPEDFGTYQIFWGARLVETCETIEQTLRYAAKFRHRLLTVSDNGTTVTETALRARAVSLLQGHGSQIWPATQNASFAEHELPSLSQAFTLRGAR